MKIYFAGSEAWLYGGYDPRERCGVKNYLSSFHYLKLDKPLPIELSRNDVLIDSGGFTARTKGIEISVEQYANFLNKYKIKLAFNLDTNSVRETISNQDYLIKNTKTYIIPIYHVSDYNECRDLIQDYMRFPYVSVGGLVGYKGSPEVRENFLRYVFYQTRDKIRVHGLGMTSRKDLLKYPFYSVDSSSWLAPARYGRSQFITKDEVLQKYRARKWSNHKDPGDRNMRWLKTCEHDIKGFLKLERDITDYWSAKGVTWEDFRC